MTDETLPRCDYYVYGLFSEAGAIFYVGKGRDRRHLTSATVNGSGKNDLKARAIKRVRETLGEVPIVLLADNLTEDDAYRMSPLSAKIAIHPGRYVERDALNIFGKRGLQRLFPSHLQHINRNPASRRRRIFNCQSSCKL